MVPRAIAPKSATRTRRIAVSELVRSVAVTATPKYPRLFPRIVQSLTTSRYGWLCHCVAIRTGVSGVTLSQTSGDSDGMPVSELASTAPDGSKNTTTFELDPG